jgi:small conductance mechanosensitive channel
MLLEQAGSLITSKLNNWVEGVIEFTPNIVVALIILLLVGLISKILKKPFYRFSRKITDKRSIRNFSTTSLQILVFSAGLFSALSVLNLGGAITSLLTGAGVAGLVIGIALQEIISNYFSGVTISVSEPFRVGDFVEIDGKEGVVKKINARSTVIESPTGQVIEIPNKNVVNNPTVNYSKLGKRRIDISSGISYESDWEVAKEVAVRVVSRIEEVDKDLPIEFFYEEFGESALIFVLRFWMDFENSQKDFFSLRSEVITKLLSAYNENNIVMPYPITTVKLEKED